MCPAKWVQSIKCRGHGCFICILLFLAWRQIFLFFLGLCLMDFRIGPWPFQGLGVLGYCTLPCACDELFISFLKACCQCLLKSILLTLDFSLAPIRGLSSSYSIYIYIKENNQLIFLLNENNLLINIIRNQLQHLLRATARMLLVSPYL